MFIAFGGGSPACVRARFFALQISALPQVVAARDNSSRRRRQAAVGRLNGDNVICERRCLEHRASRHRRRRPTVVAAAIGDCRRHLSSPKSLTTTTPTTTTMPTATTARRRQRRTSASQQTTRLRVFIVQLLAYARWRRLLLCALALAHFGRLEAYRSRALRPAATPLERLHCSSPYFAVAAPALFTPSTPVARAEICGVSQNFALLIVG